MWIKPRVILLEETEYWIPRLAEAAGRIYGVYIYDENRVVHACELQGSYELYCLGNVAQNWDTMPENLRDEIEQEPQGYEVIYLHTYAAKSGFPQLTQRCKADEYDDAWEGIMESYQCNQPNYSLPDPAMKDREELEALGQLTLMKVD
jgi:hypothetical protein